MSPTALRFAVVGVIGIGVNCGALYLMHRQVPLVVASAAATEVAIVTGYIGNGLWTFRAREHALSVRRFLRYNAVALVGLAITAASLSALVSVTNLPLLVANLGAIGAATSWNFLVSALWTFR